MGRKSIVGKKCIFVAKRINSSGHAPAPPVPIGNGVTDGPDSVLDG